MLERGAQQAAGAYINVIRTARLTLRQLEPRDACFILELLNEPGFLRFIGDKGVRTPADARAYILKGPVDSYVRHGFGLYAACLCDGTPIGICGLVKRDGLADADVGFAFLSRYTAKGYAAEAAAAVLAHAHRQLHIRRVVAITAPDNLGSIAVLEKIGLMFERRVRLADDGPELNLYATPQAGNRP
jgi:RimJ/RimL family protein N-acetyltransferase